MLVKEIDFFKEIFDAYPHQKDFMRAFFSGEYKYFIDNIHRRGGKDAVFFVCSWLYSAMIPGNHVYTLPKIGQARNVIWEGKDFDGMRWVDAIPRSLIKKFHHSQCKIYFVNGSILHMTGADNLMRSHLGSNLSSIWFSEFQLTHPHIWDYIRPIIKRNPNAKAAFNFTSLGKGHAYKLMQANKDNPDWFTRKLTVDDTRDNQGNYIYSPEQIEDERRSGMDETRILQEYYCNDDVAVKGTFFDEYIQRAREDGRIRKGVKLHPNLPVHTSWDLGSRDTNSIWFFQVQGTQYKPQFVYFYQHDKHYGNMQYYLQLLQDIKSRYGFERYGHHFMPHDIEHTEWVSGKTRKVQLMQGGLTGITPVPRVKIIERVQIARANLDSCVFDEDGCKTGLEALEVARSKWCDIKQTFVADEEHDWSSHPSAAFQYGHVGWLNSYNKPKLQHQKTYARKRA